MCSSITGARETVGADVTSRCTIRIARCGIHVRGFIRDVTRTHASLAAVYNIGHMQTLKLSVTLDTCKS